MQCFEEDSDAVQNVVSKQNRKRHLHAINLTRYLTQYQSADRGWVESDDQASKCCYLMVRVSWNGDKDSNTEEVERKRMRRW
jgi:hypothetical protein